MRQEPFFPSKENFPPPEEKKIALGKEKYFLPQGEKFLHMRKKISAYAKIFFRIYGNKFSYMRKFWPFHKEI